MKRTHGLRLCNEPANQALHGMTRQGRHRFVARKNPGADTDGRSSSPTGCITLPPDFLRRHAGRDASGCPGAAGLVLHPGGTVGVLVKSPTDHEHSYRVRFPDGFEAPPRRSEIRMLARFNEGLIGDGGPAVAHADLYQRVLYRSECRKRAARRPFRVAPGPAGGRVTGRHGSFVQVPIRKPSRRIGEGRNQSGEPDAVKCLAGRFSRSRRTRLPAGLVPV
jgi:hypothetical protein